MVRSEDQSLERLKSFLDSLVERYQKPEFIHTDPICIPHRYSKKQDIEIAGFWTAILSWGLRKTIINKATELFSLMDNSPYDFILNHSEKDRQKFLGFKHRTFQPTDTLYFLTFLQQYYRDFQSLEDAFIQDHKGKTKLCLTRFNQLFFSLPFAPSRTSKHIPTPQKRSACKRLNMFLRWMVRSNKAGVDFGIWQRIKPSQLFIPLDIHVERAARKLNLITRKQTDWNTVLELTQVLKKFDPLDPVKYDFALFGMGILESKH